MATRNDYVNNNMFDPDEAIAAAVKKRKFLLKRLLEGIQNNESKHYRANCKDKLLPLVNVCNEKASYILINMWKRCFCSLIYVYSTILGITLSP